MSQTKFETSTTVIPTLHRLMILRNISASGKTDNDVALSIIYSGPTGLIQKIGLSSSPVAERLKQRSMHCVGPQLRLSVSTPAQPACDTRANSRKNTI